MHLWSPAGQIPEPDASMIATELLTFTSGHQSPGLWAYPGDKSSGFNDIKHWVELAKLLEKGKFHGIFIADVLVCITGIV